MLEPYYPIPDTDPLHSFISAGFTPVAHPHERCARCVQKGLDCLRPPSNQHRIKSCASCRLHKKTCSPSIILSDSVQTLSAHHSPDMASSSSARPRKRLRPPHTVTEATPSHSTSHVDVESPSDSDIPSLPPKIKRSIAMTTSASRQSQYHYEDPLLPFALHTEDILLPFFAPGVIPQTKPLDLIQAQIEQILSSLPRGSLPRSSLPPGSIELIQAHIERILSFVKSMKEKESEAVPSTGVDDWDD